MSQRNVASKAATNAAARKIEAMALRRQGLSYRKIGARLGVSQTQAHKDVLECLAELAKERQAETEHHVTLELERLDALYEAVSTKAEKGDIAAINTALKIAERRARLLGLDAPTRTELSGTDGAPLSIAITAVDYRQVLAPLAPESDSDN